MLYKGGLHQQNTTLAETMLTHWQSELCVVELSASVLSQ